MVVAKIEGQNKLTGAQQTRYVLGLSHENIRRMMKGQPMLLTPETHGLPVEIFILVGRTEQSIAKKLQETITKGLS